jgi:hypothetical protein
MQMFGGCFHSGLLQVCNTSHCCNLAFTTDVLANIQTMTRIATCSRCVWLITIQQPYLTCYFLAQVLDPKLRLRMESLRHEMQWTDLVQAYLYMDGIVLQPR